MVRQIVQVAGLIAISLIAYFPALGNGFIWDDDRYIEQNYQLHSPGGLERIWARPLSAEPQYYPVTHTTLWVEYHLWGAKPLGYHLDNILLHALGAVILWRILLRLEIAGAWAAAAVWAVHPMQVESVAWATERKNVLSGVLYFLAGWAYLRACPFSNSTPTPTLPRSTRGGENAGGKAWYVASLLLFIAALLAKSVTSTLPGAILILCWWKRGRISVRDFLSVVPMLILGGAMGSLTGWMEKHVVGAMGADFDFLTPVDRVCIAGRAFWFYLVKLFWPGRLMFIYPHWSVDPVQKPGWFVYPVAAIGLVWGLWLLRKRIGRGALAGVLFYGVTLVPAMGFVNVFPMRYSYVADHFQYLAGIGIIVVVVSGIAQVACGAPTHRAETTGRGQGGFPRSTRGWDKRMWAILSVIAAVVIASLCVASNLHARIFLDRKTLWGNTVAMNPGSAMAHNNYGAALVDAGDFAGAMGQFQIVIDRWPLSADWTGVGEVYARQGDYLRARDFYLKAIDAEPVSDETVFRRLRAGGEFQLGTAYQGLAEEFPADARKYRELAVEAYERATALYPEYEAPRINLAVTLIDLGEYSRAIGECEAILDVNPDSGAAYRNWGMAYYEQGELGEALERYQRSLGLEPDNAGAMASAGGILVQMGRFDEGVEMLHKALGIDPKNEIARQNLGAALRMGGGTRP